MLFYPLALAFGADFEYQTIGAELPMSPSGLYRDNEDDILHTSHRLHRLLLPVLVYARCADYIKALLYIVSCRHCDDASLCSNSGASSMQVDMLHHSAAFADFLSLHVRQELSRH